MVKVPREPFFNFFPPSLEAFQGPRPLVGLQAARSAAGAEVGWPHGSTSPCHSCQRPGRGSALPQGPPATQPARPPPSARPRCGRPARQSDGAFLGVAGQNRQRYLKIRLEAWSTIPKGKSTRGLKAAPLLGLEHGLGGWWQEALRSALVALGDASSAARVFRKTKFRCKLGEWKNLPPPPPPPDALHIKQPRPPRADMRVTSSSRYSPGREGVLGAAPEQRRERGTGRGSPPLPPVGGRFAGVGGKGRPPSARRAALLPPLVTPPSPLMVRWLSIVSRHNKTRTEPWSRQGSNVLTGGRKTSTDTLQLFGDGG